MRQFGFPAMLAEIAALGAVLYAPGVKAVQFAVGDNNENYRDTVDRHTLVDILDPFLITSSGGANTYYTPMQSAVWAVMVRAFGQRQAPYGVLARLIHLACALLTAALAREIFSSDRAGFAAGVLFVSFVPPFFTVTYVSAMFTHGIGLVCYLAGLLAFVRFLQNGRKLAYATALLFFLVAHVSKEMAWSMLLAMAILDYGLYLPPERKRLTLANLAAFANKYWPFAFVLLAAIAVFVAKYPYGEIAHAWGGASASINILFRFFDLLTLLLWPTEMPVWAKLLLVDASVILLAAGAAYGSAPLRALLLWLIAALLPFCFANFRPITEVLRYLYLPSAVFAMAAVALARQVGAQGARQREAATAAFGAVVSIHFLATLITSWRA